MAQEPEKYLLLATNRTGTMQDELNEAGARGYRFAGTQGGETAFGGRQLSSSWRSIQTGRLFPLHPARERTLERNDAERDRTRPHPSSNFAGMTVFSLDVRQAREAAVILEAEITDD